MMLFFSLTRIVSVSIRAFDYHHADTLLFFSVIVQVYSANMRHVNLFLQWNHLSYCIMSIYNMVQ